jgi:hypothetical protein
MCGGGVEEMFRDTGKYLQPTFDAAQDRAMRELRGSGVEEMFRDTGRYLQPTFDAAQDRAMRELRGSGVEEMFRDTGKYLQPTFDAAQDRAMRELRGGMVDMYEARPAVMPDYRIPKKSIRPAVIGRGFDAAAFEAAMNQGIKDIKREAKMKREQAKKEGAGMKKRGRKRGKGFFEDLGRSFQQTFEPVSSVFRPGAEAEQLGKEVAKELIYKGIPGATGALAGTYK